MRLSWPAEDAARGGGDCSTAALLHLIHSAAKLSWPRERLCLIRYCPINPIIIVIIIADKSTNLHSVMHNIYSSCSNSEPFINLAQIIHNKTLSFLFLNNFIHILLWMRSTLRSGFEIQLLQGWKKWNINVFTSKYWMYFWISRYEITWIRNISAW